MLKKLYRNLISHYEKKIVRIALIKTWIAEWVAIIRKRNLYKNIKWTPQQTLDFNEFWIKNYGKKISPRWHKLYQSLNGVYDIRYFPEILYTTKLEPRLNPYLYSRYMSDKALIEIFSSGIVDVPETVTIRSNGFYYDKERKLVTENEAINLISEVGNVVFKPALGGSSGNGVRIVTLENGIDKKTGQHVEDIIREYNSFVVQKKILPHEAFADLYSYSINTVRITTYICNNKVFHAPLAIRVGTDGNEVDNIHAGGIVIGISDYGTLNKIGYKIGYGYSPIEYLKHPDTNVVFEGYILSGIDKIIEAAEKMHGRIPGMGIISWDFTINNKDVPVLIEANILGQSIWFTQMVNKCGFFGDNTENMFKLIKYKERK